MNRREARKVLIVSENEEFFEKIMPELNKAEFSILTARSEDEIADVPKNAGIDLVILEYTIHGKSNEGLCSTAQKDKKLKGIPIIMVCTEGAPERKELSRRVTDIHLSKPIEPDQFFKEIYRALRIPARKSLRVLADFSVSGDYMLKTFICNAKNISSSGILLETDKILHQGRSISFLFSLPHSRQIVTKGKIVRAEKNEDDQFQYGIAFHGLTRDSRIAIENFIKNNLP
jgi:DNA-binding response OmpR family regulator